MNRKHWLFRCTTYKNGGLSISRNATVYASNRGTFYVPYSVLADAGLK